MVAEDWVADARAAGLLPYPTVVVMPEQVAALKAFLSARTAEASQAAAFGPAYDAAHALSKLVNISFGRLDAFLELDALRPEIESLWKLLVDLAEGFERHPDFRPDTWTSKEGMDHVD